MERAGAWAVLLCAGCSLTSLDGLGGGTSGTAAASGGGPSGSASGSAGGGSGSGGRGAAGGGGGSAASGGAGGSSAQITIVAEPGLEGDAFLSWPPPGLCGEMVTDWYPRDPYKVIDVGRDPPCQVDVSYRAFVRLDVSPLLGASVQAAEFRFFYLQKQYPAAGVHLFRVDDAGPLSDVYWNSPIHEDLGEALTPSTTEVQWISVDATAALVAALESGSNYLVLEFRYDDETESPGGTSRWYDIVSSDSDTDQGARIVVTYAM